MTLAALRRNIGVVFQEPMLFARSIEENLRVGKPDASAAEIETALERAQASEFVGAPDRRAGDASSASAAARFRAASASASRSPARC